MKKLIIILAMSFLFLTACEEQDRYVEMVKELTKVSIPNGGTDFYGRIVKRANHEWAGDRNMIAHEIKQQCRALHDFVYLKKPDTMPTSKFANIRMDATFKFTEYDFRLYFNKEEILNLIGTDWIMVLYETEKDIKVYLNQNYKVLDYGTIFTRTIQPKFDPSMPYKVLDSLPAKERP